MSGGIGGAPADQEDPRADLIWGTVPRLVDDAEGLLDRATCDRRDRARRHRHATVRGLAQKDRALLHDASLVSSAKQDSAEAESCGLIPAFGRADP